MLTKRDFLRCAALAVVATKSGLAGARPGIVGTRDIAEAGFIYGLPIVLNYAFMYAHAVDRTSGRFKAPFNQIKNIFTHNDTAIETSILWIDLRSEPVILSVPAMDPKCYYSVMLCDLNSYNYGYIGSRATGNERGDYMVVGPDWEGATPAEIKKVFRSSTQFSVAGYRTHLHNPDDLDNVEKVKAGYRRSCYPPICRSRRQGRRGGHGGQARASQNKRTQHRSGSFANRGAMGIAPHIPG